MLKAIIYCRRSTDREDNQILSLESQMDFCAQMAKREGIEIVKVVKESKSASIPGRPGFAEMMQIIDTKKADCIITWKMNRLARNSIDAGTITWMLQNGHIQRIFTSDGIYTPDTNSILLSVLFGMSTQYTIDLKKDIRRGQRTAVSKGQMITHAPFGYKNDKNTKSATITKEGEIVKQIFQWKSDGENMEEIYGRVKKMGYKISRETCYRIIENRFYYGFMEYNGEYFRGLHTPLISKKLWDKANQKKRANWGKHINRFILKGKVRKEDTKKAYKASLSKSKTGRKYAYYHLGNDRIAEKKIAEDFEKTLPLLKMPYDQKNIILGAFLDFQKKHMEESNESLDILYSRKKQLKTKQDTLFDMRLSGEINQSVFSQKNEKLHDEIISCDEEIKEIDQIDYDVRQKASELVELLENPMEKWKSLDTLGKLEVVDYFVVELLVDSENALHYALKPLFGAILQCNVSSGGAGDRKVELYNFYRLLCRTPLESIKKMRSDWEKIGAK